MNKIWEHFRLLEGSEAHETVIEVIKAGVVFRGTNLWILIFAIFIASLGLNVNSTAVIIGAMLISPLMGPIMGMGLASGINDIELLRRSVFNYLIATSVALATSTIYFILSPLNDAHSEILARTSPNIYDVLIALFGGLAGILATSSKNKGNVLPGVAIATALMPPLCTAGYGMATLKWDFFFGAFYLFIINTVFIALATLITVRLLHFPYVQFPDKKAHLRTKRILALVVICTLLPSLYFGYDMVERNKFLKRANYFVETEAFFPNNYLLNKNINAKTKTIRLTFGGEEIQSEKIDSIKKRLIKYDLQNCNLDIKQGFSYIADEKDEKSTIVTKVLIDKESEVNRLKSKLDSNSLIKSRNAQVFNELKVLRPDLKFLIISPAITSDTIKSTGDYAVISLKKYASSKEKEKIALWLKTRLNQTDLKISIH